MGILVETPPDLRDMLVMAENSLSSEVKSSSYLTIAWFTREGGRGVFLLVTGDAGYLAVRGAQVVTRPGPEEKKRLHIKQNIF